jgi:hypothetical protein
MAGYYTVHSALCQACDAVHAHVESNGPVRSAEALFVTDDTPAGFDPDPRMLSID